MYYKTMAQRHTLCTLVQMHMKYVHKFLVALLISVHYTDKHECIYVKAHNILEDISCELTTLLSTAHTLQYQHTQHNMYMHTILMHWANNDVHIGCPILYWYCYLWSQVAFLHEGLVDYQAHSSSKTATTAN